MYISRSKARPQNSDHIGRGGEVGIETAVYLAGDERREITVVEMVHTMAVKTDRTKYISVRCFRVD